MEATSYNSQFPIGTIIRAPGKLVLAGEYAVVDGGSSIVLAINRGVECEVTSEKGIRTPNGDTRFVNHATTKFNLGLTFRDWNPVTEIIDDKPGFGGSAAACVVATKISGESIESAVGIHHSIQGSGSGIDVIASIYGGIFHWNPVNQIRTPIKNIIPIVVWTGNSAQTGDRVQRYLQYSHRSEFINISTQLTNDFVKDPIKATTLLYTNLEELSLKADIN